MVENTKELVKLPKRSKVVQKLKKRSQRFHKWKVAEAYREWYDITIVI
jgi:hypothetical protein